MILCDGKELDIVGNEEIIDSLLAASGGLYDVASCGGISNSCIIAAKVDYMESPGQAGDRR